MNKARASSRLVLLLVVCLLSSCQAGNKRTAGSASGNYTAEEISNLSQVGILKVRGFKAEVHYAITPDGYHLHLTRIINPLREQGSKLKRPILFNHGLIESSTMWLINSRHIKPKRAEHNCWPLPIDPELAKTRAEFRNAPLLAAMNGYDVWLLSMRGTDWSLYHDSLDISHPDYWKYSLDDFALSDVPSALDYIRHVTQAPKIAYAGHSQATFAIFALMATRPHFAELVEPVFAFAPVAYFSNITSVTRPNFLATDRFLSDLDGPLPESPWLFRRALSKSCSRDSLFIWGCELLEQLIAGKGVATWPAGFFTHVPFYTSVRVVRHFAQLIKSRRFSKFDHGREGNLKLYGKPEAPVYEAARIKSRSMVFFWTSSDTISHPDDVRRLISELKVPLYKNIFLEGEFNHFDCVVNKNAGFLYNRHLLETLEEFEARDGLCGPSQKTSDDQLEPTLEPLPKLDSKQDEKNHVSNSYEQQYSDGVELAEPESGASY